MTSLLEDLTLTLDTAPTAGDIDRLAEGLTEHSLESLTQPGFQPLAVFVRAEDGALRAGVFAYANWTWLHINLFWIAKDLRHCGLGSRMLQRIEKAGVERGCQQVHLDTFSYQARPFYERHGYEVFATLDDYPPGQQRFFLRKALATATQT